MENYNPVVPHRSSRPALGFPLGTAILLFIIFLFSGILSFCFQRNRPGSLRRRPQPPGDDDDPPPQGSLPTKNEPLNQNPVQVQSIPVIMPGEQIPTHMAWPCPSPLPSLPPPLPSPPRKIVVVDIPQSYSPPTTSTNSTPTVPSSISRHYLGMFV